MDGVAASVYIESSGGEKAAHRSAAKYRLAARFVPRLVRWLHDRGLNRPLLLFIARALPEVCSRLLVSSVTEGFAGGYGSTKSGCSPSIM